MKKFYVVLLCLLSLSLFSCASKNAENSVVESVETENLAVVEPVETTSVETENVSVVESVETNAAETTSDETETVEISTDETETASEENPLVSQELETIEEPEVITLEPAEETPVVEEDDEVEIVEEPVEVEPIAEVIPVKIKQEEVPAVEETPSEDLAPTDVETDAAEETAEEVQEPEIVIEPSRSVELKKLEYLDITYPGSGWIYMGLTDGSKDLTYFGRKVGTENTKFSVQAKNAGTKILHFYKNDSLTNTIIDDYLEVIVLNEKGSNKTHIAAPDFKMPVQKKKVEPAPEVEPAAEVETPVVETKPVAATTNVPAATSTATTTTSVQTSSPAVTSKAPSKENTSSPAAAKAAEEPAKTASVEPASPKTDDDEVQVVEEIDTDKLLKEIKTLVKAKNYVEANNKLALFFEHATKHRDEGLYLQGQVLEAKSEVQNITAAIESYTTLTKNYPASKYWDDANKRIIYLKRFYLEGR